MTIISDPGTALSGPALRMHLLELFLDAADFPDQVLPLAQAAEAWISGHNVPAPKEESHDQSAQTFLASANTGADAEGYRGGQPAEGGVLQPDTDGGNDGGGALREPGDTAPENSAGPEGTAGADPVEPAARRSWTEAEEREMERLVASGMSYAEIAQRLGRTVRGVNMRALATGISKRWPRSGGGKVMFTPYPLDAPWPPEADVIHIDPSADITIPVASEVVIPVPSQPPADDMVAAALEADWPTGPVQASPPEKDERERMIHDHATRIGVTTAVDFGPDQPAVDVLRGAYNDVVKSNDPGRPWIVNGARRTTKQLWEQANRERRQRGQKPIKRGT